MKQYKISKLLIVMTATLLMNNVIAAEGELKQLSNSYGCVTCHSIEPQDSKTKPVAPSFQDIAKRYHNDDDYEYLVTVIKYGSNPYKSDWKGKITGAAMPPNKGIMSDYEINKLLVGILSLDN